MFQAGIVTLQTLDDPVSVAAQMINGWAVHGSSCKEKFCVTHVKTGLLVKTFRRKDSALVFAAALAALIPEIAEASSANDILECHRQRTAEINQCIVD
jgi:hypothetical protein